MMSENPKFTKGEIKNIRYLIFFALFIITFQALQYYTTTETSKKYNTLFENSSEVMILTNAISSESSSIHRYVLNISLTSNISEKQNFKNKIIALEQANDQTFKLLAIKIFSNRELYGKTTLTFLDLWQSWKNYENKYQLFLTLLNKQKLEQEIYRKKELRPQFEFLRKNLKIFLFNSAFNQNDKTKQFALEAERKSFFLLIFGNIILVLIIIFLVYILFLEREQYH